MARNLAADEHPWMRLTLSTLAALTLAARVAHAQGAALGRAGSRCASANCPAMKRAAFIDPGLPVFRPSIESSASAYSTARTSAARMDVAPLGVVPVDAGCAPPDAQAASTAHTTAAGTIRRDTPVITSDS